MSMRRYAFDNVLAASVRPSRPASFLSGRIAIRLPPPFTQFVNIVTCGSVNGISPRMTTSYEFSVVAVTRLMSVALNALNPSVRRISA